MATFTKEEDALIDDKLQAEEDLLDELENEEIPASIREARILHFKNMTRNLAEMKGKDHGAYNEILEEKKFLEITVSEERCIAHFYHADFGRCTIVDHHLDILSKKHFESRFIKINVEKAKFFVLKLKIHVLPAILCFKKGILVDRIIGFEELGNSDNFPTDILERRLRKSGILFNSDKSHIIPKSIFFSKEKLCDESDE